MSSSVFLAEKEDLPSRVTNLLSIGLCLDNASTMNRDAISYLIQKKLYNDWVLDTSKPDSPIYTSSMKEGSIIRKIRLSQDKMKLLTYEAVDEKNKSLYIKLENIYGRFDNFPTKSILTKSSSSSESTETIDIINFQRSAKNDNFTPSKAGLRYNINVNIQGKKPEATRYWDGKKLVSVCPDPSEYIKDYKSPEAKPPVVVPVDESGFPWRSVLMGLGGVMVVVALVFAIRGARSRRS